MKIIHSILPEDKRARKVVAVGVSVVIAGFLCSWGIYGIKRYGIALFILTPLFMGACTSILYGLKGEMSSRQSRQLGFLTLAIFMAILVICAIEGFICIIMAAPIAILLTWIGSLIGYAIVRKTPEKGPAGLIVLLLSVPATAFMEKDNEPSLNAVVTSIEIAAPPELVWKNVVEFPELDEPTEFIFKTGIAYPINARIEGKGIGAVRHCNFTTGSFVEPVTVWDEARLLRFDVLEQPAPMRELSFWDIDAPHLHDYFVSERGQFKLTRLPNGHTLLEGTTWYRHHIAPEFYWQIWSEHIIHKIHTRVLNHIRKNAEKDKISLN